MRNIATEPSGGVPLTNALLNDFASGANKVFFRSSLMPRIKIRLTGEGVLYKQGKLGYTAYQVISLEHQQCTALRSNLIRFEILHCSQIHDCSKDSSCCLYLSFAMLK